MATLEDIKAAADKAMEGLAAIQTLEKKFDDMDSDTKGQFQKMKDFMESGIKESQKLDAELKLKDEKIKAVEEKQKLLETALARPASIVTDEQKDRDIARLFKKQFNAFARHDTGTRGEYFADYVKENVTDDMERKYMSVGSDPDGGYLVQPELLDPITTLVRETSLMRQLATVRTVGTDSVLIPLDNDEAGAYWAAETEPRVETKTPQLAQLNIPVNELTATPKVTQRLLDDAKVDIENWISDKVAQKMARMENTAFMVGDGVKQPRGILTFNAGTDIASRQVEQINSGSASSFGWQSLVTLQFALKTEYRRNAHWIMNRTALGSLYTAVGSDGHPIYNMAIDTNGILRERLGGYPVMEASDMPTVAANALAVAFGDFRQAYLILDRTGIRVLRDPYTDKPFVKFYTTKRVGGDVVNTEAYKLLKMSA